MKFGSIQFHPSVFNYTDSMANLKIRELIPLISANLQREDHSSKWTVRVIHSGISFTLFNITSNFDYMIGITYTKIGCLIMFDHDKYDTSFWNDFPTRFTSILDQLIIYYIHNS